MLLCRAKQAHGRLRCRTRSGNPNTYALKPCVMRAGASPSAGPLALVQEAAERLLARELAGQAYVILTKVRW